MFYWQCNLQRKEVVMKSLYNLKAYNSLEDIPRLNYEGYYWLSDSSSAVLVDNAPINFSTFEKDGKPKNPFIVEANLYNDDSKKSISVRHIDNGYILTVIDWSEGKEVEVVEKEFIGHSSLKQRRLKFHEAWDRRIDKYCEELHVLTPAGIGFVGFAEGDENE